MTTHANPSGAATLTSVVCMAAGEHVTCHMFLSHHTVVWGYLVYCVCFLFVYTITDFSAAEKDREVNQ